MDRDVPHLHARPDEVICQVAELPYTDALFKQAHRHHPGADPLEAAVRFVVHHRFSRVGSGKGFAEAE
jgi:hypothetical protein